MGAGGSKFREWLQSARETWWGPLYDATVMTSASLTFGLLPILFPWGKFAFRGTFLIDYRSMLIHGDVVMVACSLIGPALVMLWRRRVPDKMKLPELLGLFGTFIAVACVAVFFYASSDSPNETTSEAVIKTIQGHVVLMTWIITPVCFLYALLVAFLDELSGATAMELRETYNASAKTLKVHIPAGDKN